MTQTSPSVQYPDFLHTDITVCTVPGLSTHRHHRLYSTRTVYTQTSPSVQYPDCLHTDSTVCTVPGLSTLYDTDITVCTDPDCLHTDITVCTDPGLSNNNNNNNRIQRRYSRFFTISSQRRELSPIRSSGPGAIVCKSRATHRALITCKYHATYHLVRRDSSGSY